MLLCCGEYTTDEIGITKDKIGDNLDKSAHNWIDANNLKNCISIRRSFNKYIYTQSYTHYYYTKKLNQNNINSNKTRCVCIYAVMN